MSNTRVSVFSGGAAGGMSVVVRIVVVVRGMVVLIGCEDEVSSSAGFASGVGGGGGVGVNVAGVMAGVTAGVTAGRGVAVGVCVAVGGWETAVGVFVSAGRGVSVGVWVGVNVSAGGGELPCRARVSKGCSAIIKVRSAVTKISPTRICRDCTT